MLLFFYIHPYGRWSLTLLIESSWFIARQTGLIYCYFFLIRFSIVWVLFVVWLHLQSVYMSRVKGVQRDTSVKELPSVTTLLNTAFCSYLHCTDIKQNNLIEMGSVKCLCFNIIWSTFYNTCCLYNVHSLANMWWIYRQHNLFQLTGTTLTS